MNGDGRGGDSPEKLNLLGQPPAELLSEHSPTLVARLPQDSWANRPDCADHSYPSGSHCKMDFHYWNRGGETDDVGSDEKTSILRLPLLSTLARPERSGVRRMPSKKDNHQCYE